MLIGMLRTVDCLSVWQMQPRRSHICKTSFSLQNPLYLCLAQDDGLKTAATEFRTLQERFVDRQIVDIIPNALVNDANKFRAPTCESYVVPKLYSASNPTDVLYADPPAAYVLEHGCNTRMNQIRDIDRQFYDGRYIYHFDNLFPVWDWFKTTGDWRGLGEAD